jgi:hypothetical protein
VETHAETQDAVLHIPYCVDCEQLLLNPSRSNHGTCKWVMPSGSVKSSDERFTLIDQSDGNTVLYGPANQPLWSSNTARYADVWNLIMQNDGGLVSYDRHGNPIWASNKLSRGATLMVQGDDNKSNEEIWRTNTVVPQEAAPPTQTDRLLSGQGLIPGKSIVSMNGRFTFVLQSDGNLVLYGPQSQPMWASNTAGRTNVREVSMQNDGNCVLYDACNAHLWASNSANNPGAYLVVQHDGNTVIYNSANYPIWATNTVVPPEPTAPTQPDRLLSGQGLVPGSSLTSPNGLFTFTLQMDGNIVLYGPSPYNFVLWATDTAGHFNVWDSVMQNDGNFVAYNAFGAPYFATNTNGHSGAYLIVQDDANVVIYDSKNTAIWSTGTAITFQPLAVTELDGLTAG